VKNLRLKIADGRFSEKQAAQTFHGATFVWNTPNDGPRTIGVIRTPSAQYYVGWWNADHVGTRLNTHLLPVLKDADELQTMLEDYAELRGLKEAP
jgi:hypothetical protein